MGKNNKLKDSELILIREMAEYEKMLKGEIPYNYVFGAIHEFNGLDPKKLKNPFFQQK